MKTHDATSDKDIKSHALAHNQQQHKENAGRGNTSLDTTGQRKQKQIIESSPYLAAQKKKVGNISGLAVQKQSVPEEEDLMQGKLTAQQQPEEEEDLLQGKFAAQRQVGLEEEELSQGKFAAQRQGPDDDEDLLQGKFAAEKMQMKKGGHNTRQQKSNQVQENKTGIPDEIKANMENALGTDFSDVRIHPNSGKAAEVSALAYTQGSDVHFAPGQFKPESTVGQQLLGHELAHVVQQRQGRVEPTGEVAGLPVNDSPDLENEADRLAEKISK